MRSQFAELYIAEVLGHRLAYGKSGCCAVSVKQLGDLQLDEVSPTNARAFTAELVAKGISIKPHLTMFKTMLTAAHEVGVLESVPKLPRLHGESTRPLTG